MGQNKNAWTIGVKVMHEFLILSLQLFCNTESISKLKISKIMHIMCLIRFHHNKAWKIPAKLKN